MSKGTCLCGAIAFEYSGEPHSTVLCHCKDCQKWSGGAYTANAVVSREAFTITRGEPKRYVTKGDSGKQNERFFCSGCGSGLYTALEAMPAVYFVKTGALEEAEARDLTVAMEIYTKDRVGFLKPLGGARQCWGAEGLA